MKVESCQEEAERFNKIFEEGERFEKAIKNLPKDNPLIEDEVRRLIDNIKRYKKAVDNLENVIKNRKNYNYSAEDIEESDRRRKIYHDGIIRAISKICKLVPDNIYFQNLSETERSEIGEQALILAEYFKLKEEAEKKAA